MFTASWRRKTWKAIGEFLLVESRSRFLAFLTSTVSLDIISDESKSLQRPLWMMFAEATQLVISREHNGLGSRSFNERNSLFNMAKRYTLSA